MNKNTIQFRNFMQSLSKDDKQQYRAMSINQQKDWYISFLEAHYSPKNKPSPISFKKL